MTSIPIKEPNTVTPEEVCEALRREIAVRVRIYPRWVENDRLTLGKASHEIAAMKAALVIAEEYAARFRLL